MLERCLEVGVGVGVTGRGVGVGVGVGAGVNKLGTFLALFQCLWKLCNKVCFPCEGGRGRGLPAALGATCQIYHAFLRIFKFREVFEIRKN